MQRLLILMLALQTGWATPALAQAPSLLPGFHQSPWFGEPRREAWLQDDVHVVMTLPANFSSQRPTELILFTTPNGNTVEQTLGRQPVPDGDWKFNIQHIAAQTRLWQQLNPDRNIVLTCLAPAGLSWPAWRAAHPDHTTRIPQLIQTLESWLPAPPESITLTCHSGGGSFLIGLMNSHETIPDRIHRMIFLDANYSYSDDQQHGDKLLAWLRKDPRHHLSVVAYDDRNVTLNGKNIVSDTGGTYRATGRMRDRLRRDIEWTESTAGPFQISTALNGQVRLIVHSNPDVKILHTALVGDMSGHLETLSHGTPHEARNFLQSPVAYQDFIQPAPGFPPRKPDAPGGRAILKGLTNADRHERERVIREHLLAGNVPSWLRTWVPVEIPIENQPNRSARIEVLPDYLAIGSDDDFVRVPVTPQTAQSVADLLDASLPTRKLVDAITKAAPRRVEPFPITMNRDSVEAFVIHQDHIEQQTGPGSHDQLLAGHKKDVVLTKRLTEKPNRVALYGWPHLNNEPIQPLTIVHVDWYVDYSHGIRLIRRAMTVDGKARDLNTLRRDPAQHVLVSDEGPITAGY